MKYKNLLGNIHLFSSFKSHLSRVFRGNFITRSAPFKIFTAFEWEITYDLITHISDNVISDLVSKNHIQDNYRIFRSYYSKISDGKLKQLLSECHILDLANIYNLANLNASNNSTFVGASLKNILATQPQYKVMPLTNVFINLSLTYNQNQEITVSSNMLMTKVTTLIQAFAAFFSIRLDNKTDLQAIIDTHNLKYANSAFKGLRVEDIDWNRFPVHKGFIEALSEHCNFDYTYIDVNNSLPAIGDFFEINVIFQTIDKKGTVISTDFNAIEQYTLPSDGVDLYTVSFNKALCIRPVLLPSRDESDYVDQYTYSDVQKHNELYDVNEFTQKYLPLIYARSVNVIKDNMNSFRVLKTQVAPSGLGRAEQQTVQNFYYGVDSPVEQKIIASIFSGIEITNYGLPSSSKGGGNKSGGSSPNNPGPMKPGPNEGQSSSSKPDNPSNPDSGGSPPPGDSPDTGEDSQSSSSNRNIEEFQQLQSFPLEYFELEDVITEDYNSGNIDTGNAYKARNVLRNGIIKHGAKLTGTALKTALLAYIKAKMGSEKSLIHVEQKLENKLADEIRFDNQFGVNVPLPSFRK